MSSMIASTGLYCVYTTVSSSEAKGLLELGFSDDQIKGSDHVHISVVKNGGLRYWYNGTVPTASQGHPIWEGDERIIRGLKNARNLKVIADVGALTDVEVAITIGAF